MKFIFSTEGNEIGFSREEINRFSSEWNAEQTESEVGSADFCEAVADFLFTRHKHLTPIVEQLDDHELMAHIKIVG